MKKVRLQVWGRVQGVAFRYMTKMLADQMGITGTVQNKEDGSVYIEASGPAHDLDVFVDKVKVSPSPSGRVDRWELKELPTQSTHTKFRIIG